MSDLSEVVGFLRTNVPLFSGFTDERLNEIVVGSRVASFEEHEVLAHHGADATHFGVILSGTVGASVTGDGGEREYLGRLEASETFGDMALMTGDKLAADFIAEDRKSVV